MSSELKLDQIDVDGAIRDTAGEMGETLAADGDTRLDFFKKAGIAGGGVLSGGALLSALVPGAAVAKGSGKHDRPPKSFGKGDVGILNYALTLEYLEAEFYKEARKRGQVRTPVVKDFLAVVVRDETAHVRILKNILGKKAIAKPKFDFGRSTRSQDAFIKTSYALENTGVSAYLGQAFNIDDRKVLAGALSIVTIEGRHAGLIGEIHKGRKGIAPDGPTDNPVGAKDTLKAVKKTGFIKG